jgi:hypothetical protein
MNGESRIDGILLGYLPYEGACEIKTYAGAVGIYYFSSRLNATTKAQRGLYQHLINCPVRLILEPESWTVIRIEPNEIENDRELSERCEDRVGARSSSE